jgi:hypothetical protein
VRLLRRDIESLRGKIGFGASQAEEELLFSRPAVPIRLFFFAVFWPGFGLVGVFVFCPGAIFRPPDTLRP